MQPEVLIIQVLDYDTHPLQLGGEVKSPEHSDLDVHVFDHQALLDTGPEILLDDLALLQVDWLLGVLDRIRGLDHCDNEFVKLVDFSWIIFYDPFCGFEHFDI